MSLKMDKSNAERIQSLIGFLRADKEADMGNAEKAAAKVLEENFTKVVSYAEAMDERDNEKWVIYSGLISALSAVIIVCLALSRSNAQN